MDEKEINGMFRVTVVTLLVALIALHLGGL